MVVHCTVSNHSLAPHCGCHWDNIYAQLLFLSTLQLLLLNRFFFSIRGMKTDLKSSVIHTSVCMTSDGTAWQQRKQLNRGAKLRADKCWRHFLYKSESLMSQLFSLTPTEPSYIFYLFWIICCDVRPVSLNWGCASACSTMFSVFGLKIHRNDTTAVNFFLSNEIRKILIYYKLHVIMLNIFLFN